MRLRSAGSSSSLADLGRSSVIVHDAAGAPFQEQARDIFAVEVVRAGQYRQYRGRGLQQDCVPPMGTRLPATKRLGSRVERCSMRREYRSARPRFRS